MGPIIVYGSYSGGNFQFRGIGFFSGWGVNKTLSPGDSTALQLIATMT